MKINRTLLEMLDAGTYTSRNAREVAAGSVARCANAATAAGAEGSRDSLTPPTWQECADRGMSATEAAMARGVSRASASEAAKRLGLKFRDARKDAAHAERMRRRHADPKFAAAHAERAAERMRRLNADPEFAAAHAERMRRRHADPSYNPLVLLTRSERADYDALKEARYSRDEALEAIGRVDLIRGAQQ